MTHIIFGGAGFIGSNLAKQIHNAGDHCIVFDDLSLGSIKNVDFLDDKNIVVGDINDSSQIEKLTSKLNDTNAETIKVWHLAANSDIIRGVKDSNVDFTQTFLTTQNILQFMQQNRITKLYFSSTSAVYGDKGDKLIAETSANLHPISNYGAYKLASEAIISAAREDFLDDVVIFRFPNVVGTPATHGVILDFIRKLEITPNELVVLGDGSQQKSYIHVDDLITAMLLCASTDHNERLPIFNIGNIDEGTTVRQIAESVVRYVSPDALIKYGSEPRGWKGDIPKFYYDVSKIQKLDWSPCYTSSQAVVKTISEILDNDKN